MIIILALSQFHHMHITHQYSLITSAEIMIFIPFSKFCLQSDFNTFMLYVKFILY